MILREAIVAQYQQINLFTPVLFDHALLTVFRTLTLATDVYLELCIPVLLHIKLNQFFSCVLYPCHTPEKKNFDLVLYNSDLETWYQGTLPCHKLLHAEITFGY